MSRRHWINLGIQLVILVSMIGVALYDIDIYVLLVSITLLVLPPVNWSVAGVLLWTTRQDPTIRTLADAADNAVTWAVNSTIAAVIGALVIARFLGILPNQVGVPLTVMVGFIVVTSSLPAFRWLRTWRDVWMPRVRNRDDTTTVFPLDPDR